MNHISLKNLINFFALEERRYLTKNIFFQVFKTTEAPTALLTHLSLQEKKRVQEIKHKEKRHAYIISHALTRILLTLISKKNIAPKDWLFHYNSMGKPSITEEIQFNISYAKDITIIAISLQHKIGVDITLCSPLEYNNLPLSLLHNNEIKLLSNIKKEEAYKYFLKMWTYKEAVAKALGLGVSLDFNEIDSTLAKHQYLSIFQTKLPINHHDYHLSIAYKLKPNTI